MKKTETEVKRDFVVIDNLCFKLKEECEKGLTKEVVDSLQHILGVSINHYAPLEFFKAEERLNQFVSKSGCNMNDFEIILRNYVFWFNHYFQQGKIKMELPT